MFRAFIVYCFLLTILLSMHLEIDVGATKTLFAVFSADGQKKTEHKIATDHNYEDFKASIKKALNEDLATYQFSHCCCAVPGKVDRENGVGIVFGNLPWQNVPIADDFAQILGQVRIFVENDAKMAGLYEAKSLPEFNRLLYIAPGTGVGIAFIVDGANDLSIDDLGGRTFLLDWRAKKIAWDEISSGRALTSKYGQKAAEITKPQIWQDYVHGLAFGINRLIESKKPEVVVIGGGVGAHFEKFQPYLEKELKKIGSSQVTMPKILKARRPEEAVIYGCYEYIKVNS